MSITVKGNFNKTESFLYGFRKHKVNYYLILKKYAQEGVKALARYTPKESGETAESWYYEIEQNKDSYVIYWNNRHMTKNTSIGSVALLLQYGHGTKNGGFVEGIDYINPALQEVFQKMADELWEGLIK